MSIYIYKCACKECGRIIQIDTCENTITLNDFLLDETVLVSPAEVEIVSTENIKHGITIEINGNQFMVSNAAKKHFFELINKMKGEPIS